MLDQRLEDAPGGVAVPLVHGVARLAQMAYRGGSLADLLELIGPEPAPAAELAAWLMDQSWACALTFSPGEAARLQGRALSLRRVFRVRGPAAGPRLLALCAPGDLMTNAPLDFLAEPAGIRLDLAYLGHDGALPGAVPEHDVAIVAASESAPRVLDALGRLFDRWPRPILNDPACIGRISRAWLPRRLAGLPGLVAAPAEEMSRDDLVASGPQAILARMGGSTLLRPLGSHGGQGLVRIDRPEQMAAALAACDADAFTLSAFIDTRGRDGWYRKLRVALVGGCPFICHMAASDHWMVHYLSAGMADEAAKRAAEAEAMAGFDRFARRHATAFAGLAGAIGLDYVSVDCTEAQDGRLLVFEVDSAAIVHSMDLPDRYPYKRPVMQRCYDAFGAMVRHRARAAQQAVTQAC